MSFTFKRAHDFFQSGQFNQARDIYLNIIEINPENHQAHHLIALTYCQQGRIDEAICWFEKALKLESHQAIYHYNYANALLTTQQWNKALSHYQRAIIIDPQYLDAYFKIGLIYQEQRQWEKAIEFFEITLELDSELPEAYYQLGIISQHLQRYHQALKFFDHVLRIQPSHLEAAINKAGILKQEYRPEEALKLYQTILSMHPNSQEVHYNLGLMYLEQGFFEMAQNHIQKGLQKLRQSPLNPCGSSLIFMAHYDPHLSHKDLQTSIQLWGQKTEASISPFHTKTSSKRLLRIGFISPDFRNHAATSFTYLLLKAFQHPDYEIVCFSDVKHPDEWTNKFKRLATQWFETWELKDTQLAHLIVEQEIDILIDPGVGHTDNNRLRTFAHQCAPLQISNYPTTTGISRIQYRISDEIVSPKGQKDILYLADSMFCYLPPDNYPDIQQIPFNKNGYITFGSFHQLPKLNLPLFFLWAQILRETPQSKILLKNKAFHSPLIQKRIKRIFEELKVSEKQLIFKDHSPSRFEHLNEYNSIDIALDSYPYNGMTTTTEALWMGVPVITLSHEQPFSRVSRSFLQTLNLSELTSQSPEEYVQRAIQLARQPHLISHLNKTLRDKMKISPLCDQERYFKSIRTMVKQL